MTMRHVRLVDQSRSLWADAQVADEGGYFGGTIDLRSTPARLRILFEEFEEIVNGQMFSFLDEIQEKIDSLALKVIFDDGAEVDVKDLQVFPGTGELSFRLASLPPQTARLD